MVEPQPTKIPIWNTGGGNRTEPSSGEKASGWAVDDQPPSSYFNWLQYYTGAWFTWLNERVEKGTLERDLIVRALTPTTTGAGGNLTINAGDGFTTGQGGGIVINAGDGVGASQAGGAVNVNSGDPGSSGSAGNINLTCGSAVGVNGPSVNITAGDASDANGGGVNIRGGDVTGTNRSAGVVTVSTGTSTGTGGGKIELYCSEAGASGSGVNSGLLYAFFDGQSGAQDIGLQRHVRFNNTQTFDATRGNFRISPRTEPTTPTTGDVYHDSGTEQVRSWDGTGYRAFNPYVYDLNQGDQTGQTPTAGVGTGSTVVFQNLPNGGSIGTTPIRYQIPAGYLSSEAKIVVKFGATKGVSVSNTPYVGIYLGSIGSGPPYITPSGFVASFITASDWLTCYGEVNLSLLTASASSVLYQRHQVAYDNSVDLRNGSSRITGIDTTGALDLFMVGIMNGAVYAIDLDYMTVQIH